MGDDVEYSFKLVLIGASGVGKSSLVTRYIENKFCDNFLQPSGEDYMSQIVELDGHKIELQIWDTAGQERFRTITSSYYRGAQGVVLVYDVTDNVSFGDTTQWLQEVTRYASPKIQVQIILVGNKSDLVTQRVVSTEDGQQFAKKNQTKFFEASAKDGTNVGEIFTFIARAIFDVNNKAEESGSKPEPTIALVGPSCLCCLVS